MPTSNLWNSFRSSRWFKPVIALAGVVILLFAGLLALPMLLDINTYRGQIVSQLEQKLGRKVSLGKMGLRVLPSIKVTVDQVAIGDDPAIVQGDFVRAKSVRLQMGLFALLRGKPEVSGIELVEPEVTLIKTSADKWNWSTLKPLEETGQESEQAPFDLLITNGSFKLIDRSSTQQLEKNYSGVNISLDDFSPRRSFNFVIGLTMAGDKAGKLEVAGNAGPIDRKDSSQTPVDARVKLDAVELSSLEALAGMQSPQNGHAGKLTVDAKISGKMADGLNATGDIKAEQLRLIEGVEPAKQPLEAAFKLSLKSAKASDGQSEIALKLDQADLKLGKTAASITGQINKLPASPTFDLQLKGDQMALESLLESAYAFGFGPPAGTKASGAATINLKATGDQNNFALNGQAEIRDLKFESSSLPQAIQISELKLAADPQTVTASPFRATLSRTTVDFRGLKISDYGSAEKAPRAHLEIATSNAQVEDLLKIAESFGVRPDTTGSGTASLTATIETELGAKAAATQINGQGKISGARLQPSSLKKPLEVANADLAFTGDSARIDNLQAQLGSSQANGWLSVKNFNAPALGFDLKANQLNIAELQAAMAGSSQSKASTPLRGEGQLSVGKLVLDTITASDVQSKVVMANNIILLSPISLRLYGGSYQGTVKIDQNGGAPEIALNGKFSGLDINQFLSASSGQTSSIYGKADGTVDIRGRNDAAGMAQSLTGNGFVSISNGKFMSFDLMKQAEVLGRLVNLPTGGAGSAFRSLRTNLRFDRGKLTTDALQLVMEDMQVGGDGWLQLGDNPSVSYEVLAKLSPALTKRVMPGGSSEGGRTPITLGTGLNSVVGNFFMDQGGIVLPLKMSGSLKQPVFGLNSSMLQAKAKEKLKENLKEGLVDQFLKKPGATPADPNKPAESKPADKPADILKGVLDRFKKKEKP